MTQNEFTDAMRLMFADIDREIELAKADGNALQAAGVRPGGGIFLRRSDSFVTPSSGANCNLAKSDQLTTSTSSSSR